MSPWIVKTKTQWGLEDKSVHRVHCTDYTDLSKKLPCKIIHGIHSIHKEWTLNEPKLLRKLSATKRNNEAQTVKICIIHRWRHQGSSMLCITNFPRLLSRHMQNFEYLYLLHSFLCNHIMNSFKVTIHLKYKMSIKQQFLWFIVDDRQKATKPGGTRESLSADWMKSMSENRVINHNFYVCKTAWQWDWYGRMFWISLIWIRCKQFANCSVIQPKLCQVWRMFMSWLS